MTKPQIGLGRVDDFRQLTAREVVERIHHRYDVIEHKRNERAPKSRSRQTEARQNRYESMPEHLF